MILAFLRGLLKPYYLQGSRSVAAENLVLEALALKEVARHGCEQVMMQAAFSEKFADKRVPELMREFGRSLRRLSELSMLNISWQANAEARGKVESILELYEALEKAGIINDQISVKSPDDI